MSQALSTKNKASLRRTFNATNKQLAEVMDTLTPRRRTFVESRMAGHSLVESCRIAGLSDTSSYTLTTDPKVKECLRLASVLASSSLGITREDVLQGFMDAVRAASSSTEITMAWREIGKVIGAYEPEKIEVTHKLEDVTGQKLRVMRDEDLAALAAGTKGQVLEDDILDAEYEVLSSALEEPEEVVYDD